MHEVLILYINHFCNNPYGTEALALVIVFRAWHLQYYRTYCYSASACAARDKQLVMSACLSVSTKISRSQDQSISVTHKYNESVKQLTRYEAQGVPIRWTELLHLPLSVQIGSQYYLALQLFWFEGFIVL